MGKFVFRSSRTVLDYVEFVEYIIPTLNDGLLSDFELAQLCHGYFKASTHVYIYIYIYGHYVRLLNLEARTAA